MRVRISGSRSRGGDFGSIPDDDPDVSCVPRPRKTRCPLDDKGHRLVGIEAAPHKLRAYLGNRGFDHFG